MSDISKDLAALRIPQEERGGRAGPRRAHRRYPPRYSRGLAVAPGTGRRRCRPSPVKVAPATAKAGGPSAPGAVLNASGYVMARRRATVSSKVTGKVIDVLIEEGQPVKAGQILAHLDDTQPRAALALAEAQLASARKSGGRGSGAPGAGRAHARPPAAAAEGRRRRQGGARRGAVGRRLAEGADRATRSSRSAWPRARSTSRRPTSPTWSCARRSAASSISKDAQPGEMISPVSAGGGFTRTGIGTIVDMSSLEIEVDVNETYINRVTPGQKVEAVLDAYQDWRDSGARHHDDSDRRPAEGDGPRPHRVRRSSGSADPARHGREGVVPARRAGRGPGGGAGGAARAGAEGGDSHRGRRVDRVRGEGRPRRAARGQRRARNRRSGGSAVGH